MIATPAEIARLEAFFDQVKIPATMKLDSASTMTNVKDFKKMVIDHLKDNTMAERALEPLYQKLLIIEKLLKENG